MGDVSIAVRMGVANGNSLWILEGGDGRAFEGGAVYLTERGHTAHLSW